VFLPWTPEVGICDLIRSNVATHRLGIQAYTGITNLTISQASVNTHVGKTGKEQRETCKVVIDELASVIAKKKTWSDDRAREALFDYLVDETTKTSQQVMLKLSGKLFS